MDNCTLNKEIFDCLMEKVQFSDCLLRGYSSVVIKDNAVVGIGYSFIPYGKKCSEKGICSRQVLQNEFKCNYKFYEVCPIIHAEMSAILSCKTVENCDGADLYLLGINQQDKSIYKNAFPCPLCLRHIVHVGIKTIFVVQSENNCNEFNFKGDKFQ